MISEEQIPVRVNRTNQTLARLLQEAGYPDVERLAAECSHKELVTDILLSREVLTPQEANTYLEQAVGLSALDPAYIAFTPSFLSHAAILIPREIALSERVFMIKHEGIHVHLIIADPLDDEALARLEARTGSRLHLYVCHAAAIIKAIEDNYPSQAAAPRETPDELIMAAADAVHRHQVAGGSESHDFIHHALLIRMMAVLLEHLVNDGVSDVHIESLRDSLRIRARLDGVLVTRWSLPPALRRPLSARLKLVSGLSPQPENVPRDGRIDFNLVPNRSLDMRVSSLPSLYGEKIVLRILEKGKKRIRLDGLDLPAGQLEMLHSTVRRSNGLVLVTGPTGSGKTTTLYALLDELNAESLNISTVEDPVEYEIAGYTQVSCDEEQGLSFASVLRALMRQDPDVIMVGEIRDLETADIAVKAAMTGHLVFSTLHANDAAATVSRLVNLGVVPYLLASCGMVIIAQRLVRCICANCREPYQPANEIARMLGIEPGVSVYHGRGCDRCHGTGYAGRSCLMEIMTVGDAIEKMIVAQRPVVKIRRMAIQQGMETLRHRALDLMRRGKIPPEEVLRVTLNDVVE